MLLTRSIVSYRPHSVCTARQQGVLECNSETGCCAYVQHAVHNQQLMSVARHTRLLLTQWSNSALRFTAKLICLYCNAATAWQVPCARVADLDFFILHVQGIHQLPCCAAEIWRSLPPQLQSSKRYCQYKYPSCIASRLPMTQSGPA